MNLNILYQFNEKYVPFAGISMVSLFENNKPADKITVYVLAEQLTEISKSLLHKQAAAYGREIHFINTETLVDSLQRLGVPKYRNSYATNMKMFAPDFMDESLNRLLYIDSDTIIKGDLTALTTIDMQSKPIAMILDSLGGRHKQLIGLHSDDTYFNGGVILYDIKLWKQKRCTERIVHHIKNVRAHYMSPDQDLINLVFCGEIMKLSPAYNLQPIHFICTYKQYTKYFRQKNYYSATEISNAICQPKILHTFRYLGEFPWHKGSLHPHTTDFDYYMKLSLWSDYQKQPTERKSPVFRMEKWLYRHLPKTWFLGIFKIGFEFFIWQSNQDSLHQRNNYYM